MSHYDGLMESADLAPLEVVRQRLAAGADVAAIHRLVALAGGRFAFLIETPFRLVPRYAVGHCDLALTDVEVVGQSWTMAWAETLFLSRWGSVTEQREGGMTL